MSLWTIAFTQASSKKRMNSSVLELVALTGPPIEIDARKRTHNITIEGRNRFFIGFAPFSETGPGLAIRFPFTTDEKHIIFSAPEARGLKRVGKIRDRFSAELAFPVVEVTQQ